MAEFKRPIGQAQQDMLRMLVQHGWWSEGCGWKFGTPFRTRQILDSLVQRRLVVKQQDGVYRPWNPRLL